MNTSAPKPRAACTNSKTFLFSRFNISKFARRTLLLIGCEITQGRWLHCPSIIRAFRFHRLIHMPCSNLSYAKATSSLLLNKHRNTDMLLVENYILGAYWHFLSSFSRPWQPKNIAASSFITSPRYRSSYTLQQTRRDATFYLTVIPRHQHWT